MTNNDVEQIFRIEEYEDFKGRNKKGVWIYKLDADYTYATHKPAEYFDSEWLNIKEDGTLTIKANYAWDGCSIKKSILDLFIIGTPDGTINIHTMKPKTYYASLVHDALYQYFGYHSYTRAEIDKLFYDMMVENEFKLSKLYYWAVRLLGGFFVRKEAAVTHHYVLLR